MPLFFVFSPKGDQICSAVYQPRAVEEEVKKKKKIGRAKSRNSTSMNSKRSADEVSMRSRTRKPRRFFDDDDDDGDGDQKRQKRGRHLTTRWSTEDDARILETAASKKRGKWVALAASSHFATGGGISSDVLRNRAYNLRNRDNHDVGAHVVANRKRRALDDDDVREGKRVDNKRRVAAHEKTSLKRKREADERASARDKELVAMSVAGATPPAPISDDVRLRCIANFNELNAERCWRRVPCACCEQLCFLKDLATSTAARPDSDAFADATTMRFATLPTPSAHVELADVGDVDVVRERVDAGRSVWLLTNESTFVHIDRPLGSKRKRRRHDDDGGGGGGDDGDDDGHDDDDVFVAARVAAVVRVETSTPRRGSSVLVRRFERDGTSACLTIELSSTSTVAVLSAEYADGVIAALDRARSRLPILDDLAWFGVRLFTLDDLDAGGSCELTKSLRDRLRAPEIPEKARDGESDASWRRRRRRVRFRHLVFDSERARWQLDPRAIIGGTAANISLAELRAKPFTLCAPCWGSFRAGNVPKLALANANQTGLHLAEASDRVRRGVYEVLHDHLPEDLTLPQMNEVEESFVSPYHHRLYVLRLGDVDPSARAQPAEQKSRAVKGNLCSYTRTSSWVDGCGQYDLDALPSKFIVVFIDTQQRMDELRARIRRREVAPWRVPVLRGKVVRRCVMVWRKLRVSSFVGRPPAGASDDDVGAWERLERPSRHETDERTTRLHQLSDDYYDVPEALWQSSTAAARSKAHATHLQQEFDEARRGYSDNLDISSTPSSSLCCSTSATSTTPAPPTTSEELDHGRPDGSDDAGEVVVAEVEVNANVNMDARNVDLVRAAAVKYRPQHMDRHDPSKSKKKEKKKKKKENVGDEDEEKKGQEQEQDEEEEEEEEEEGEPNVACVHTYDRDKPITEYNNPALHVSFAPSLFVLARGGADVRAASKTVLATFVGDREVEDEEEEERRDFQCNVVDGGGVDADKNDDVANVIEISDKLLPGDDEYADETAARVSLQNALRKNHCRSTVAQCEERLRQLLAQRGVARFVNVGLEGRNARFLKHNSRLFGAHASWMAKEFNLWMRHSIIANATWKIKVAFLDGDVDKTIETLEAAAKGDAQARKAQFHLANSAYAVTKTVKGTPQHREAFRDIFCGYGITFGLGTIFWTVNPAPAHDVRFLRLVDGGTHIIFDAPELWPGASKRAEMVANDPVASALFYEKVISVYAEALLQFPFGENEAHGLGVWSLAVAALGITEMQGRGNCHFHGIAHSPFSCNHVQSWLRDDVKRRAFFEFVDSCLCAELPRGLKGASCDARGYGVLDRDWKEQHPIAVGRDATTGARKLAVVTQNIACYPAPQLLWFAAATGPLVHAAELDDLRASCVETWVLVDDDALAPRSSVRSTTAASRRQCRRGAYPARVVALDATANAIEVEWPDDVTLGATRRQWFSPSKCTLFDRPGFDLDLERRRMLIQAQNLSHRCHPQPAAPGLGCYSNCKDAACLHCKSGWPFPLCSEGQRDLIARSARGVFVDRRPGHATFARGEVDAPEMRGERPLLRRVLHIRPPRALVDDDGRRSHANRDSEPFVVSDDVADEPTFAVQRTSSAVRAVCWLVDAMMDDAVVLRHEREWETVVDSSDGERFDTLATSLQIQICVADAATLPLNLVLRRDCHGPTDATRVCVVLKDDRVAGAYAAVVVIDAKRGLEHGMFDRQTVFDDTKSAKRTVAELVAIVRMFVARSYGASATTGAASAAEKNEEDVDIVVVSYNGDQHVVIHSPTATVLEGFNQCTKFMFTGDHAKANLLYITTYVTKWGYCDSNVRELHLASLKFLRNRIDETSLPDAVRRTRRVVIAAAFAVVRECTYSYPYLALMMVGTGPHYHTHKSKLLSLRLFIGDGDQTSAVSADDAVEKSSETKETKGVVVDGTCDVARGNLDKLVLANALLDYELRPAECELESPVRFYERGEKKKLSSKREKHADADGGDDDNSDADAGADAVADADADADVVFADVDHADVVDDNEDNDDDRRDDTGSGNVYAGRRFPKRTHKLRFKGSHPESNSKLAHRFAKEMRVVCLYPFFGWPRRPSHFAYLVVRFANVSEPSVVTWMSTMTQPENAVRQLVEALDQYSVAALTMYTPWRVALRRSPLQLGTYSARFATRFASWLSETQWAALVARAEDEHAELVTHADEDFAIALLDVDTAEKRTGDMSDDADVAFESPLRVSTVQPKRRTEDEVVTEKDSSSSSPFWAVARLENHQLFHDGNDDRKLTRDLLNQARAPADANGNFSTGVDEEGNESSTRWQDMIDDDPMSTEMLDSSTLAILRQALRGTEEGQGNKAEIARPLTMLKTAQAKLGKFKSFFENSTPYPTQQSAELSKRRDVEPATSHVIRGPTIQRTKQDRAWTKEIARQNKIERETIHTVAPVAASVANLSHAEVNAHQTDANQSAAPACATTMQIPSTSLDERLTIEEVLKRGSPYVDSATGEFHKRGARVEGESRRALQIILPALRNTFILRKKTRWLRMLLIGEAGIGKSVVIDAIQWYASENGFASAIVICARTARAAMNVGGDTLHTFISHGRGETISETAKQLWHGKGLLIEDEMSMISLELDSKLAEAATSTQRAAEEYRGDDDFADNTDTPDDDDGEGSDGTDGWGQMHVLKVGDPYQLPVISMDGHNPYFLAGAMGDATSVNRGERNARVMSAFAKVSSNTKYLRAGVALYRSLTTVIELDGKNHRFDDDWWCELNRRWRFAYSELCDVSLEDRERIMREDADRFNSECLLDGGGDKCPRSTDPNLLKSTLVCERNLIRMSFGRLRAIGKAKAAGMKAIGYVSTDEFQGRPLREWSEKLATKLFTEDKKHNMPAVFMYAPDLACAPPANVARLKYLRIVNGSKGFMRSIKLNPEEPPMPKRGESRYDPDVWWLAFPPEYVVVHFPDSKLDPERPLDGLPPKCVAIHLAAKYRFKYELTAMQRRCLAETSTMTSISIGRANIPLLCVEGLTGYGAQCLTMRDGIVLDGDWCSYEEDEEDDDSEQRRKRNVIWASVPYTSISRVRNSSKCVVLNPLRVSTLRKFSLPKDLVADWRRLQALKDKTKLRHSLDEEAEPRATEQNLTN
jgi:hypothetical protein